MNNKKLLLEINAVLEDGGVETWIFGGWAEELLEIIKPREHKDIDLLFPAEDFGLVEKFFSEHKHGEEIKEKHFPHKRAFMYKETMVELFLVQKDEMGDYTNFWGTKKHYWPENVFAFERDGLSIASKEALLSYRENYETLRQ